MKIDIAATLHDLRPGAKWCFRNEDYSTLEWGDAYSDPPTIDEVRARQAELQSIEDLREEEESRLESIRSDLFKRFSELPVKVRKKFYSDKVTITESFRDGDIDVAILTIQEIDVETQDEIDAKESLLSIISPLL